MEKFKTITTIKTINETTGEETEKTTERNYIEKRWNELTREEKEKEIKNNFNSIYECYQEDLYFNFIDNIDYIKETITEIDFENVYTDSNSQGGWIDSVKDFKYNDEGISIYGEFIEVYDINLHIRKYINYITEDDITLSSYYNTPCDKLEKIEKTKKYKNYINNIITTINNWIDKINKECSVIINEEYNAPTCLNIEKEANWLDNYFFDDTFIYEEIEEDLKNEK